MRLYTTETITIPVRDGRTLDVLVVRHDTHEKQPILHEKPADRSIGVLWLHGGGYATGSAKLVMMSAGLELAREYNVTLFVPNYRLSGKAPYPAALHDAYDTLLYMKENSRALDIRRSQLMVGGESAGGGLAAALCLYARDRKEVAIAYQMPLYPMIDDRDTDTNRDNSGIFWNSRRNRAAWKMYLKPFYPEKIKKKERETVIPALDIPAYAVPARAKSLRNLPPAYSFVAKGEPFYAETVEYFRRLKASGVPCHLDEYDFSEHAFDMMLPFLSVSKKARARFIKQFDYAMKHYSARN